mmetsp:Transcript_29778/g.54687  ORF Transcript_29778/g.54687 Transcript_29778/m.54687 type:complete len:111 (-) Transcript_29778:162-494(-)
MRIGSTSGVFIVCTPEIIVRAHSDGDDDGAFDDLAVGGNEGGEEGMKLVEGEFVESTTITSGVISSLFVVEKDMPTAMAATINKIHTMAKKHLACFCFHHTTVGSAGVAV